MLLRCLPCKGGDDKPQRLRKFPRSGKRPRSAVSDISDDEYTDYAVAGAKANNTFLSVRHLVKLVAVELFVYLLLYYAINLVYRFALPPDRQRDFERYVEYFDGSIGSYARDITFLLGFYVSLVAKRWWEQYRLLPWPDNLAMMLSGLVIANNRESRILRRNILRYALLSYVLCIRRFSSNLKHHLPMTQDIIDLGLMTNEEAKRLDTAEFDNSNKSKRRSLLDSQWWMPLNWACNLVKFGKMKEIIPSDVKEVLKAIVGFRTSLEAVESHIYVTIPVVYKVVVSVAVYAYFGMTLVGSQILISTEENPRVDIYFPIFVVFKLILLIGWLKVANCIEKPFGTDDTDFQMHHLVARHIRAVAVVIDEFDNFPHAAEYLRSKSESEGNLENDLTAAAGDEMRPRDHKISNAESAVIDELKEWNGVKDRPRAPRDWTREAYPTGNGNVGGHADDNGMQGGSKRCGFSNGRARVYPADADEDDG